MNELDYKILAENGFDVVHVPMVKYPNGPGSYELRTAKSVSEMIQRESKKVVEGLSGRLKDLHTNP